MNKWEEKRLVEVAEVVAGGTPSTSNPDYWNGDVSWITPNDLSTYSRRNIYYGQRNISELGLKSSSAKLLPQNTILLTTRAPIGYVAIAGKSVCTNQGFKNLICKKDIIDYIYMFYFLKMNKPVLEMFATGATFPELSAITLKKIKIQIPPLPIQQRIADILSEYDELIENNNRRIELLETAAQQIYKEWFVRMRFPNHKNTQLENGIPQGWEVVKLDDIIQIVDGDRGNNYPKQHEFSDEGYCLFINAGNVTKNGFDFSTNNFISKEKDSVLRKGKLQGNDIIMTTRGTVGNLAFYSKFVPYDNIRINSGMVIIRQKSSIVNSIFLYSLLRSDNVKKAIELYSSGSAQPQLPIKDMRKIKVILPNEYLIKQFTDKVFEIETLIGNLKTQKSKLIKQRDLLLSRLMSGKLEV